MCAADHLGQFDLRKVLGQGAQITVWLALDPRMEREVAIKVMLPGAGSDDKAVAQWLQEARSVVSVVHPNIVSVYEAASGAAPLAHAGAFVAPHVQPAAPARVVPKGH